MRTYALLLCLCAGDLVAQEITFQSSPAAAASYYKEHDTGRFGECMNTTHVDTAMFYSTATDAVEKVAEGPFRMEFYADGALYRKIEIRTTATGDVPVGSYEEYHPNGSLRLSGRLKGYNEQHVPVRTGAWTERDATGKVLWEKQLP